MPVAGAVDLKLVGAVDLWDSPALGQDAGSTGVKITSDLAAVAPQADVVIDFSSHHGTAGNAERMAQWKKAWVIGTTGLVAEEKAAVEKTAKVIPVVMAPNMSLGVNLLFALLEQAGRALKDKGYDVEIIERHHRRKKDSPSGTAIGLGQAVAAGMDIGPRQGRRTRPARGREERSPADRDRISRRARRGLRRRPHGHLRGGRRVPRTFAPGDESRHALPSARFAPRPGPRAASPACTA